MQASNRMEAGIKKSTRLMLRPQSTQDNKTTTTIKIINKYKYRI